jgi:hypothetical protein
MSPPRSKKSVAKVAHRPTRVGHPVTSFAERMAAFAQSARGARSARRARSSIAQDDARKHKRAGGH